MAWQENIIFSFITIEIDKSCLTQGHFTHEPHRPITIALPADLTGGKGGVGLSSLHTTLQGPTDVKTTWIPPWHQMDHVP